MPEQYQLSIVIPVRNGENFLQEALDNITAQGINHMAELLLVNDGSTDGTQEICEAFQQKNLLPTTILNTPGLGPAAARNQGIQCAKGLYMTFMDHDDLWVESKAIRQIKLLNEHPEHMMIVGKVQFFSADPSRLDYFHFRHTDNALHHVHLGAITCRKELFTQVGLLDEDLPYSEDHDFFLRCREQGITIFYDDQISYRVRLHDTNMTKDKSLQDMHVLKVIRASLKRRQYQELV